MFDTCYGEGNVNSLFSRITDKKVLFVTQENIYRKYQDLIPKEYSLEFIDSMEEKCLEERNASVERCDTVVGFGGGMSIDAAKYFAWKRQVDCYLVPTAVSVDACYSYPIALRRNSIVCYEGEVIAKGIYVDYTVIKSAPKILNLSGVGDVLSCYTALYDWDLMTKAGKGTPVVDSLYKTASELVEKLFVSTAEIAHLTDVGIKRIMEAYRWVGIEGYRHRFCHFEEGSEHYLAYCLESICGKHLLHGQLVCMCAYITAKLQREGRQKRIKSFTDEIGLSIRPSDVGVETSELRSALSEANGFVVDNKLAWSVLNERKITPIFTEEVLRELK